METMNTSRRVCNPNGLLDVTGSSSRGKRGRDEEDYATDPAYIQETENPPKRRLLSVFVEVASRLFSWVGGSNSESSLEHNKNSHSTECLSHEFKPETTEENTSNRLDRNTKDEKDETLIVVEGARDGADIFDDLSPILMSEVKSTSNGLSYSADLSPKFETTIIYSESDEEFSEHSLSIDDTAIMTTSSRSTSPRKLNANQETVYHFESTDIRRTPQRDSTEPIIIDDSDDELPVKLLRSPFVRSTFGKPNSVRKISTSGGFRKSRKSPLFEDRRKKHVKTITRELLNACVPFSQAKDLGYSGSEREYADFTDYARQVYEASIGAGPQDEVFISNFFKPRQEIETKHKTSTQRKALVSETQTPTKKIRERALSKKLESWGEEEWLKNLRERIEKAHLFKSPEDRPFTPIFDKLKQQDLLLDQLVSSSYYGNSSLLLNFVDFYRLMSKERRLNQSEIIFPNCLKKLMRRLSGHLDLDLKKLLKVLMLP
ncbi:hypothetical protein K7432_012499 [Basidiobolus ranarum]|uniref:Uncharacterized protein n=1 Tax=Basidiobolus ranarum TaxID=34480 RepID=A0ABR2VS63_9FUNG